VSVNFEFATASRIIFGPGSASQLGPIAKSFGGSALVILGGNTARASDLVAALKAAGVQCEIFSTSGEPTLETIERGRAEALRIECQVVVSIGGGSVIDSGKAIAAMATNEGSLLDYLEVIGKGDPLQKPSLPFIAVPTTAGTGSEVTRNAVLGSPGHKVKASLRSPFMLPRVAIVDPDLTIHLPPEITASTGLDALTQLIEPFLSSRANPMTDALCREGIPKGIRALPIAFRNGRDAAARCDMLLVSLFGGLALANAGLGVVHGFAGPIGGMFPAPHGAICAALLPAAMKANHSALAKRARECESLKRFAELGRLLTGAQNASPAVAVESVRNLSQSLNVKALRHFGINPSHFPELIIKARQSSSMKSNPIVLEDQELTGILYESL
jgi:alcohol dehydrogenase class IV